MSLRFAIGLYRAGFMPVPSGDVDQWINGDQPCFRCQLTHGMAARADVADQLPLQVPVAPSPAVPCGRARSRRSGGACGRRHCGVWRIQIGPGRTGETGWGGAAAGGRGPRRFSCCCRRFSAWKGQGMPADGQMPGCTGRKAALLFLGDVRIALLGRRGQNCRQQAIQTLLKDNRTHGRAQHHPCQGTIRRS